MYHSYQPMYYPQKDNTTKNILALGVAVGVGVGGYFLWDEWKKHENTEKVKDEPKIDDATDEIAKASDTANSTKDVPKKKESSTAAKETAKDSSEQDTSKDTSTEDETTEESAENEDGESKTKELKCVVGFSACKNHNTGEVLGKCCDGKKCIRRGNFWRCAGPGDCASETQQCDEIPCCDITIHGKTLTAKQKWGGCWCEFV